MPRKFFKTIVEITILSEDEPFGAGMTLDQISHEIREGSCSGVHGVTSETELTPKQAADALGEQDSDPEFFQLDEHGNEIDA